MPGPAFGSFFLLLFVSGVYTFNNKQWINKDIGQQLPECEGRKPEAWEADWKWVLRGWCTADILIETSSLWGFLWAHSSKDRGRGDHRWPGRDVHGQVMLPTKFTRDVFIWSPGQWPNPLFTEDQGTLYIQRAHLEIPGPRVKQAAGRTGQGRAEQSRNPWECASRGWRWVRAPSSPGRAGAVSFGDGGRLMCKPASSALPFCVSGGSSPIWTFSSSFPLQMPAAQNPPRLKMATWSTRFASSAKPITNCALLEMVRPGRMPPVPPLPRGMEPGWLVERACDFWSQEIQVLMRVLSLAAVAFWAN